MFVLISQVPGLGGPSPSRAVRPGPPASATDLKRRSAEQSFRAGQAAEKAGRTSEAELKYRTGESVDPTFASNFLALADLFVKKKNFAAADVQLQLLVAFNPNLPRAHYKLAEVQRLEKLEALAVASYDAELKISPNFQPAIKGREIAQIAMHDRAQGPTNARTPRPLLTQTTGQVALGPGPTPAPRPGDALASLSVEAKNYLLGLSEDFNFTGALPTPYPNTDVATLQRTLSARPTYETILAVGSAALLNGRLDLASTAFRAAIQKGPKDWRGLYLAGLEAQVEDDYPKAQEYFRESERRVSRPETLTSLALVELRGGDTNAAYTDARKALSLDGGYAPGRFVAGMLALVRSDLTTAKADLTTAVSTGSAPPRAAYFLDAASKTTR